VSTEITSAFRAEDQRAVDAIARKKDDLARARKLSPALIAPLEAEIATCEQALDRARAAALDHERERVAALRATAERQRALTELHESTSIDPDEASRIVHAAAVAQYLEAATKRRCDAAHSAAASAYGRARKDIAERNQAVLYAERLAGEVIDRELGRVPPETRPGVIAFLPLVFPVEGRAAYAKSFEFRDGHPSYDVPPPILEYDSACRGVLANVELWRAQAVKQAEALGALVPSP
jgi:hypothetical protein